MSRRRKVAIALFVVLVLMVGLVIIADRIGVGVAEDRIADQANVELQQVGANSFARPSVEIAGFPFLTQVLGGNYKKITITATDARSGDIKLERMTLVATDVAANASDLINGRGPVIAAQVTGTAVMTWDTVRSLIRLDNLSLPFDPSELAIKVANGKIELRLPVSLAGVSTTLLANGEINAVGGRIELRILDVTTEGAQLPSAAKSLLDQVRGRLKATISTPRMPFNLVVDDVKSTASGVSVRASANGIHLLT